jgi:hypothetical protein
MVPLPELVVRTVFIDTYILPSTLLPLTLMTEGQHIFRFWSPLEHSSEFFLIFERCKTNIVHMASSSVLCRPGLFPQCQLTLIRFNLRHCHLKVTFREWVARRSFQAFFNKLHKKLSHPPQFVLDESQPVFH